MKYAIGLSERQTRRVLAQAARGNAQVIIEPIDLPDRTALGFVVSGDEAIMVVELTGARHLWLSELVGRMCGVQLFLGEKYLFNTRVVAGPAWHGSEQLTLACPETVQVVQRRRFWRAQLAPSSEVILSWNGHHGRERTAAALLNVSSEGLACRVPSGTTSVLSVGRKLTVEFRLPPDRTPYVFEALVRNAAPSSDDALILGLEFHVSPVDEVAAARQQQLRDALYQPRYRTAEVAPS